MIAVVVVACALGATVAFAARPPTAEGVLTGWAALYGIPSVLIVGRGIPLKRVVMDWGKIIFQPLPIAYLIGLLFFIMSGNVGPAAVFGLIMLVVGWGALLAAALSGDGNLCESSESSSAGHRPAASGPDLGRCGVSTRREPGTS
jgi:hypothetical protein